MNRQKYKGDNEIKSSQNSVFITQSACRIDKDFPKLSENRQPSKGESRNKPLMKKAHPFLITGINQN